MSEVEGQPLLRAALGGLPIQEQLDAGTLLRLGLHLEAAPRAFRSQVSDLQFTEPFLSIAREVRWQLHVGEHALLPAAAQNTTGARSQCARARNRAHVCAKFETRDRINFSS